jgi:hypothetical protein
MRTNLDPQFIGTGCSYPVTITNSDGTNYTFTGSETLAATLWNPVIGTAYCNPAVSLTSVPNSVVTITISSANTLTLPSPGRYSVTVTSTVGSGDPKVILDASIPIYQAIGVELNQPGLISLDNAIAATPNISSSQIPYLQWLISVASDMIEQYCNRHFIARDYDEIYDGNGFGSLVLRNFPVNRVDRLSLNPRPALSIKNVNTSTVQRASVQLHMGGKSIHQKDIPLVGTGIRLQTTSLGVVSSPVIVPFASCPTIQDVATYINGIGGGWVATATPPFGKYPAVDLRAPQGSLDAANSRQAKLNVYTQDSTSYTFDPNTGEINFGGEDTYGPLENFGPYFFIDPDPFVLRGPAAIRVMYNAGFDTVPDAVQYACALSVQKLFDEANTSRIFEREKLGDYEYQLRKQSLGMSGLPEAATQILNLYRDFRD